jgi:2-oxoglutarate ferredoxin oxidoreductase subunit beta
MSESQAAQEIVRRKATDYKTDLKPVWCPGCGDFGALTAFYNAFAEVGIDPREVAIISGIGCSGRFGYFIKSYGFHVVHGRVLPIAMGVKVANPNLHVFGISGDGDALAIGGGHIPHMARRNMKMVYVILDNAIYGLTKGQASPTSPEIMRTGTTPAGGFEKPIDPVLLMLAYGVTFVGRAYTAKHKTISNLLVEAINHNGFAVIHAISPCPTFNKNVTFKSVSQIIEDIPADHDPTNRMKAMELALSKDKLYLGLFYRSEEPTLEQKLSLEQRYAMKVDKNKALDNLLSRFQ